ncbi:TIGR01906 family membrane protein, partial [Clostridium tarantellae]
PIYSLSIKLFNLTKITGLPSSFLLEDYKTIIKFLQIPWINNLKLKYFTMSSTGHIHFNEVKNIFFLLQILLIICFIIGIIIYILNKKNIVIFSFKSLNYFFYLTLLIVTIVIIAFYVNFNLLFNKFHEIFFNNDYWIFDYRYDPIILALPEEFFMLCAIAIILCLLLFSITAKIIYKFKS